MTAPLQIPTYTLQNREYTCLSMLKAECIRAAREFQRGGQEERARQWLAMFLQLGTLVDLEATSGDQT